MRVALEKHLGSLGCRWTVPTGGMFFWLELPEGVDAMALLPRAVDAGVAFVPGAAFYCAEARPNTLRLSFVTVSAERITAGVETLGGVLRTALDASRPREAMAR
jgi:2-aminoadipate transaminase